MEKNTSNESCSLKEQNLAYGGSALIEGVMMRGKSGMAFTVKKPDGSLYKEYSDKPSIGERIKPLGWPFIRGIVGFVDNMITSSKVLNKSGEIAFPEPPQDAVGVGDARTQESPSNHYAKKPTIWETILSWLLMLLTFAIVIVIFMIVPRMLPEVANKIFPDINTFTAENYPFLYNLVSGVLRLVLFFGYVLIISLMPDMKRVFGYHGAEHKTINTYEAHDDLTVENVRKHTRLHPRCGTSFIFIVFLITLFVFPFFDIFLYRMAWFKSIADIQFGTKLQHLIVIAFHIVIGMPIVSSISYELLKLSAKFQKTWIMKIFIAPGLFFQLFTTREPEDNMIKCAILSLAMVLGDEAVDTPRHVDDDIVISHKTPIAAAVTAVLMLPIIMMINGDDNGI
ncbi:MAG: DUF1385 domain-containing protein [Spirochaetales bacterium]|nr:DUF1385 domain-containing protein [Spirochaetales bacterium]